MVELGSVAETSARSGFHLFLGNLLSEVLNAVTIVVIARLLSPEEMGVYGLSLVLPGIFAIFSDLGLGQSMTRYVTRFQSSGRWGDVKRVVMTGLLVPSVLSCLLATLMYLTTDFLAVTVMKRPDFSEILKIMSVLIVVQTVYAMATGVLYGLERMDLTGSLMVIRSAVKMVSAISLVNLGFGVHGLIYGHLIGVSVVSIISVPLILLYIRRKNDERIEYSDESSLFKVLRFGFPLYLTTFLIRFEVGYRGLLLSWFSNITAIGNLDVANKFLSLVSFFTLPMTTVVYPAFSKFTFSEQPEKLRVLYRTSVRYATLIIIPVTFAIIIHSSQGIELLFGSRYELAPLFLSLIILQYLAVGLGSLSMFTFLNSQGDTVTTFRLNMINIILKIFLGTLLIWKWGITGLLIAMLASVFIGNLVNIHVIGKIYSVNIDFIYTCKVVWSSLIASIITSLILRLFSNSGLLNQIIVGGFVFFLSCLILAPLFKIIQLKDLNTFRRILKNGRMLYLILSPFITFIERVIGLLSQVRASS